MIDTAIHRRGRRAKRRWPDMWRISVPSSGQATPMPRLLDHVIDADRSGPSGNNQDETADDGEVLEAGGQLSLEFDAIQAQRIVREGRRDHGESEKQERGRPRP